MNYLKFQTDMMKRMDKNDKNVCRTGIVENPFKDNLVVISNGFMAMVLPEDKVFLNIKMDATEIVKRLLKEFSEGDYKLAGKTYCIDYSNKDKYGKVLWTKSVQKLDDGCGKTAFVRKDYLDLFGKNCFCYIQKRTDPVFITDEGMEILGFILPVNIIEG